MAFAGRLDPRQNPREFPVFHFDNSYARLPEKFYASAYPEPVEGPKLLKFNEALAKELGVEADFADPALFDPARLAATLAGNVVPQGAMPIAMAYAGHQFGSFVPQLGDGRAILLGEVVDANGMRRDIQLKGAGPTPFSRRGDGRAALGPVLREYIVSEAMHALGIPATRALAAVATGEQVYREMPEQGAVFVRVAASHVRVGTFQFFAARGDTEGVKTLADYVIERHYPDLKPDLEAGQNAYLALLRAVAFAQADLIARWLGVGFIHGVMNTDNMTISGETIDFGPCAFLDEYNQMKVFSSIDQGGRYAYRNQPGIGQWNIARLAECLVPLLDEDQDKAVDAANGVLKEFGERFQSAWIAVFRAKIGLAEPADGDGQLVQDLLTAMQEAEADFTLVFRGLADAAEGSDERFLTCFGDPEKAVEWLAAWRERLDAEPRDGAERAAAMRAVNPAIIPRNHRIQEAISAANYGDFSFFERLLEALERPYDERPDYADLMTPPKPDERVTRTFCGT
jgi:serine/tyrosine/threonine adenylyltransferase